MTAVAAPLPRRRRPGVRTVYAWELRKLRAQKRTYIGLGAAALVPAIFIVALLFNAGNGGGDGEIPFERYVRETGLAFAELRRHRATLEEAYMELTRDAVEFALPPAEPEVAK